jgi:hypothetical protein
MSKVDCSKIIEVIGKENLISLNNDFHLLILPVSDLEYLENKDNVNDIKNKLRKIFRAANHIAK